MSNPSSTILSILTCIFRSPSTLYHNIQSSTEMDLFLWMGFERPIVMSGVEDVVKKFNILDNALKKVFSKVDPLLVVSLIFDRKANEKHIYTVEAILKPGENMKALREEVIENTGMAPSFYLSGTKMIVSHTLDLEFLKWINDREDIISIKGSKFSAGGSSDF